MKVVGHENREAVVSVVVSITTRTGGRCKFLTDVQDMLYITLTF